MRIGCSFLLLLLAAAAQAQQDSPWQGEWGTFTGPHAEQGRRLSIHDCASGTCRFLVEARSPAGNTGTSSDGTLTLQSSTAARATLPGSSPQQTCTLLLARATGAKPAIVVEATGAACTSYYSTSPAISMAGNYPRRAAQTYSGSHADECFLDTSPALAATCTHPGLAALEARWSSLADEYPLHPPSPQSVGFSDAQKLDAALLRSCDIDSVPASCLERRYTEEIAAMQSSKDAYLASTVERGDPATGGQSARRIAGTYRHRFANGDVQGHHYTTTDSLTIQAVGAASIHFRTELNFFNGHSCSLSGGALFRKNGSFVFDETPDHAYEPGTPACRLAIIPTANGVLFKDITGSCKSYCGARGSWNGEGFTFKERVSEVAPPRTR